MTHIQDEALADTIVSVLRPYAARIELYGSHARGEARPDSDIDILVELRPQDERPSKEKRSSQAKVAPQIADKGYCSSKCVSYHGANYT